MCTTQGSAHGSRPTRHPPRTSRATHDNSAPYTCAHSTGHRTRPRSVVANRQRRDQTSCVLTMGACAQCIAHTSPHTHTGTVRARSSEAPLPSPQARIPVAYFRAATGSTQLRSPASARAQGPAQRKASRLSPASMHAHRARAPSLPCMRTVNVGPSSRRCHTELTPA